MYGMYGSVLNKERVDAATDSFIRSFILAPFTYLGVVGLLLLINVGFRFGRPLADGLSLRVYRRDERRGFRRGACS